MAPIPLPIASPVRGTSFRPDSVHAVREGMEALVERDPGNPYDAQACKVTVGGELVGYLPRALAERMCERPEGAWRATVTAVLTGEHATGLRITVHGAAHAAPGRTPTAPLDPASGPGREVPGREVPGREVPVHALSGRYLGRLLSDDGTEITVQSDDGHQARYPHHLVHIPQAA